MIRYSIKWIGVAAVLMQALCPAQTPPGYTITTVAGNGTSGFSGDPGAATSAQLDGPVALAVDASGNLYIADQFNQRIRKVASGTITTIAGNGTAGYAGDKKGATGALLDNPDGVAVDAAGNLYVADSANVVIRKITLGTITTVAGNNVQGYGGDGGLATNAQLGSPSGVAVDASNFYIADATGNGTYAIRQVVLKDGKITTLASGLNNPRGIAVDTAGNLYVADSGSNRVRKITANGTVTTVAGNGTGGFSGDGGPAISASLFRPSGVALDGAGNLYIADTTNSRIRRVTTDGTITTVAGNGKFIYAGDGGPAASASLYFPSGVAVDQAGNVYIADTGNNAVRMLTPNAAPVPAISAGRVTSVGGYGGFASVAPGTWMEIHGSGFASTTRLWTPADFNNVVNAPTSLDGTSVKIGGQDAFVEYISGDQINVQVPSNVATGTQQVVVNTAAGASAPYAINVNATQPGLLAPASFNIGGTQYVVALFSDAVTYVLPPGAIPGVNSRQAKPGETITLYGIGFGPVTPDIPAGQIVQQKHDLVSPVQIRFGGTPGTVTYQGLTQTFVGLYTFSVIVPAIPGGDTVPLTFTQGGVSGTQALAIAVQN